MRVTFLCLFLYPVSLVFQLELDQQNIETFIELQQQRKNLEKNFVIGDSHSLPSFKVLHLFFLTEIGAVPLRLFLCSFLFTNQLFAWAITILFCNTIKLSTKTARVLQDSLCTEQTQSI